MYQTLCKCLRRIGNGKRVKHLLLVQCGNPYYGNGTSTSSKVQHRLEK